MKQETRNGDLGQSGQNFAESKYQDLHESIRSILLILSMKQETRKLGTGISDRMDRIYKIRDLHSSPPGFLIDF